MANPFGDGVMDGLKAQTPQPLSEIQHHGLEYRRGYICGYAYNLAEAVGDRQKAAFEAGLLSRRYGLERDRIAEFFSEYGNPQTVVYFYAGYDTPGGNEAVRTLR